MQGKFKRIVLRNITDFKEYKERTGEIERETEREREIERERKREKDRERWREK